MEKAMDRRQKKTRDAIFAAFGRLLEKKRYEHITVQEIIDEANVGRSTFYAHFEAKEELLRAMCTGVFHHIFTQALPKEAEHGYAAGLRNLELKLGHILYHLQEHRVNLTGILAGESASLFMRHFRAYTEDLFRLYLDEFSANVPRDYLLNHLVTSFAETVSWWFSKKERCSPEEAAAMFMRVNGAGEGR